MCLEHKRKGKRHRTHGIETFKSPRLVGIQHHRGPQKAKGAAWGPGRGRGAKGSFPSLCTPVSPSSPIGYWVSLRLQLRGPWGGIGCKQAPEYCLMEPAKAQLKPWGQVGRGPNSSRSLLRPCLPPVAPESSCPLARTGLLLPKSSIRVQLFITQAWTNLKVLLLSRHPTPQHHPTAHHMWLCLPYWAKTQLGAGLVLNQGVTPPAWSLLCSWVPTRLQVLTFIF